MIDYGDEVERIMGGPPSKLAFRALCAALGRTGSPEGLVSLCNERLTSWPDLAREATWSWLAALDAGYTKPTWPLVRSLALGSGPLGTLDPALPDPRSRSEVRGVTHLNLGWYASDHLAALVETIEHWDNLRAIQVAGLIDRDGELLAKLAGSAAITRIESLNLVSIQEDMWHFEKPPFRPPPGQPLRLRHAGLRAPDLIHLMRSGLVPDLHSADVLVCSINEAYELVDCEELAQLDRLAIGFRCGKKGQQLLRKPYFGSVIDEDDEACEAFFARADLANLRHLKVQGVAVGLSREGLGARGVAGIVASGVLRQLTELTLELLPIEDVAIASILAEIDHDYIEKLTLSDLVATDLTAVAFVAAHAFPRLRHLDLSGNRLDAKGAQQLATEVQLPALEHLDLSGRGGGSPYCGRPNVQPVGDIGARAWAASHNATKLAYLNMSATGLEGDGLVVLMNSERMHNLTVLDLSHNSIGNWPATLSNAPAWFTLQSLTIAECSLDNDDIEALAATTLAPHLRSISLAYNSVGSQGARALASWALLPQLWELNLHDNIIGNDGLIELATSHQAQSLLELDLEQDCSNAAAQKADTQMPAEVVDHAAFPNLDSIFLGIVDEYRSARYSSGFPADVRKEFTSTTSTRPELAAFLTHLDMGELAATDGSSSDDAARASAGISPDFRTERSARYARFIEEARDVARRMIDG